MSKKYTGSAKSLANTIAINGKPVSAPILSILSMLGLVTVLDKQTPAGGKGKKINLLEVETKTVTLEVTDYSGPIVTRPRGKKKRDLDAAAAAAASLNASTETVEDTGSETGAPVDNEVQSVEHDAEPVAAAA